MDLTLGFEIGAEWKIMSSKTALILSSSDPERRFLTLLDIAGGIMSLEVSTPSTNISISCWALSSSVGRTAGSSV